MALKIIITSNPIRTLRLNLNRNLTSTSHLLKSSLPIRYYSNDTPVKYTATKASKIKIAENIDFYGDEKDDRPKYQPLILGVSLSVFLVYFCMLREENDIDEKLKGNPEYASLTTQLVELQFKLAYCEKNNLPTGALIEKIEELKEKARRVK